LTTFTQFGEVLSSQSAIPEKRFIMRHVLPFVGHAWRAMPSILVYPTLFLSFFFLPLFSVIVLVLSSCRMSKIMTGNGGSRRYQPIGRLTA